MTILHNAAEVLRCFSTERPDLTVTDVVTQLGMPKASASRLMKSMRDAGLLETIGASKRHRPGRLLLDLAAAFRSSSRVLNRAGEVVEQVSRTFGHTGYVSVRDRKEVTAVVDFQGTNDLRVVSNLGRRLHAHMSATGRTLLARLPDEEVAALYADDPRKDDLLSLLVGIRAQGFAFSSQESTPGVDAIAIAVADPATDEVVSLCIVYPHTLVDDDGRDAIIAALAKGAAEIANDLGDSTFLAPVIQGKGLHG